MSTGWAIFWAVVSAAAIFTAGSWLPRTWAMLREAGPRGAHEYRPPPRVQATVTGLDEWESWDDTDVTEAIRLVPEPDLAPLPEPGGLALVRADVADAEAFIAYVQREWATDVMAAITRELEAVR